MLFNFYEHFQTEEKFSDGRATFNCQQPIAVPEKTVETQ